MTESTQPYQLRNTPRSMSATRPYPPPPSFTTTPPSHPTDGPGEWQNVHWPLYSWLGATAYSDEGELGRR